MDTVFKMLMWAPLVLGFSVSAIEIKEGLSKDSDLYKLCMLIIVMVLASGYFLMKQDGSMMAKAVIVITYLLIIYQSSLIINNGTMTSSANTEMIMNTAKLAYAAAVVELGLMAYEKFKQQ
jgi:hypothetical protein